MKRVAGKFVLIIGGASGIGLSAAKLLTKEGSKVVIGDYNNEETVVTNWHIMSDFLIPLLIQKPIDHPDDVSERFMHIRGNYNAKAALECAIWDLYAREKNLPLAKALGE